MWDKLKVWIGDLADTISPEIVQGQVRHFLTGAGGAAIIGGIAGSEWWLAIAGVIAYGIGAGWSWLQKLNDPVPPANLAPPTPPAAP